MRVFQLHDDSDTYECLVSRGPSDRAVLLGGFDGRPMATAWKPIEVEVLRDESHSPNSRILPDLSIVGGFAPLLSRRAASILAPLLEGSAELLPVRLKEAQYLALNVTHVSDALDHGRSTLKRFQDGRRVMRVERHIFRPELLDRPIFKIPEMLRSWVYVTDAFVEAVEVSDLLGFRFQPVWDGESHSGTVD